MGVGDATGPRSGVTPTPFDSPTVPNVGTSSVEGSTKVEGPVDVLTSDTPVAAETVGQAKTHPSRNLPSDARTSYVSLPGYTSATPTQRGRIDRLMAQLPVDEQATLRVILVASAWQQAAIRDDVLTLIENLPLLGDAGGAPRHRGATRGSTPLEAVALLMEPRAGARRAPMLNRAHDGKSLAHHLARAASTPLDAELLRAIAPQTRAQVLGELVREAADPGRINQGNANSCGAAVIQYQLVGTNPAEYVRLCAGLLTSGEVQSAGGTMLRRNPDSIFPTASHARSPTEQLFQGALMELGSPANYKYDADNNSDVQAGSVMDRLPLVLRIFAWLLFPIGLALKLIPLNQSGLMPWEYGPGAEAVFGADERWRLSYHGFPNPEESQIELLERMSQEGDLAWRGVAISMRWGAGHFLNVVGIDRTTTPAALMLRNPHGSKSTFNRGDSVAGGMIPAGVTLEDPQTGVVRVSLTEANVDLITGIYYPESMSVPDPTWENAPI